MAMRFDKPSPAMVALFDALIQGRPVERRAMFGMPCAFAGSQMCVGLFANSQAYAGSLPAKAPRKARGKTRARPTAAPRKRTR